MMISVLLSLRQLIVLGIGVMACVNLQAQNLQVGRYSLLAATPTKAQTELLVTTVIIQFPERIQTVGEAVRYLLQRSGYRLANTESIGLDAKTLFALPLPAVHRNLGPMMLKAALETLAGSLFRLVQDPLHRLISFERCAIGQFDRLETNVTIEKEVSPDED